MPLAARRSPLTASEGTVDARDVIMAACSAMESPRFDVMSCAGPRRPAGVTLGGSIPVAVAREASAVLRRLGIKHIDIAGLSQV